MRNIRIIYQLPILTPSQEWCCERGCDVTEPVLHENVYSHNLTTGEKQSEEYYVCRFCKTKLMIWDNSVNKNVDAAEECYQEPISAFDSEDTVKIIEPVESLAARFIDKKYHGATGRILRLHPDDWSCKQVKVSGGGMIWVNQCYLENINEVAK